jgi:hypothetical protein
MIGCVFDAPADASAAVAATTTTTDDSPVMLSVSGAGVAGFPALPTSNRKHQATGGKQQAASSKQQAATNMPQPVIK